MSQFTGLPAVLADRLDKVKTPTAAQLAAPLRTIHFEFRLSSTREALRPEYPVRVGKYELVAIVDALTLLQ